MKLVSIILGMSASLCSLIFLWFGDPNKSWQTLDQLSHTSACLYQHWTQRGLVTHQPQGVALSLKVDQLILALGDTLEFNLQARQAGYISIWNLGSSGAVSQVYPSRGVAPLKPNQLYRSAALGFNLVAQPPAGVEALVVLWTRNPPPQPLTPRFHDQRALQEAFAAQHIDANDWALDKASYCLYQP